MSEHTKEPWVVVDCREDGIERITIAAEPGVVICRIENMVSGKPLTDEDVANARRIVACVNACAGFDTAALDLIASVGGMMHKMVATAALAKQNEQQAERIKELEAQIDMRKIATALHEQQARSMAERLKEKNALIEQAREALIHYAKEDARNARHYPPEFAKDVLAAIERHQKGEK